MTRPSWDEYFIQVADTIAKRSTCDRGRSGCVIVRDKRILVTGYVGSLPGFAHCDEVGHEFKHVIHTDKSKTKHCVRTMHAEQNALCQAAKNGIFTDGATLYCRMTPCRKCAELVISCGIVRVVCEYRYPKGRESEEIFYKAGIEIVFLNNEILEYGEHCK